MMDNKRTYRLAYRAVAWSQKMTSSISLKDRRSSVNTLPLLVPM